MERTKYTAKFKMKIVLAILQGDKELSEICSEYSLSNELVCQWKQEFLQNAHFAFSTASDRKAAKKRQNSLNKRTARMEKAIDQLTLERDFLQDCFRQLGVPLPKLQGNDLKE